MARKCFHLSVYSVTRCTAKCILYLLRNNDINTDIVKEL